MTNSDLKISLLDDAPTEKPEQIWSGLNNYADRLADTLPDLPVTSPVLINGDWGCGKTTLLKALQNRVSANNHLTPTVWFDAWRYEGETALLPALIRAVWDAAPDKIHRDVTTRGFFNTAWQCAVAVGMRVAPIAATAAGATLLSSILEGMTPSNLDKDIKSVKTQKSIKPPPDPTEQLWKNFSRILNEAWPDSSLFIFIDDLDRCSPEGSVALLDGLRLLISGSHGKINCRFIVALDKKVVSDAITKKFSGISGYDGNRYLEKIFPLSFDLPVPNQREIATLHKSFFQDMQRKMPQDAELWNNQRDALSEALRDPLFNNPRLMKRCINRFRLLITFESRSEDSSTSFVTNNSDRTLVKWIAATERWPNLRRLVRSRGHGYWEKVANALHDPSNAMPDDEAKFILEEQGAKVWVQREMLGSKNIRVTEFLDAEIRLQRWGL